MKNKIIPTLTGKTAENFIKKIESNESKKHSIDFNKQVKEKKNILLKSELKSDFKFWDDMWN